MRQQLQFQLNKATYSQIQYLVFPNASTQMHINLQVNGTNRPSEESGEYSFRYPTNRTRSFQTQRAAQGDLCSAHQRVPRAKSKYQRYRYLLDQSESQQQQHQSNQQQYPDKCQLYKPTIRSKTQQKAEKAQSQTKQVLQHLRQKYSYSGMHNAGAQPNQRQNIPIDDTNIHAQKSVRTDIDIGYNKRFSFLEPHKNKQNIRDNVKMEQVMVSLQIQLCKLKQMQAQTHKQKPETIQISNLRTQLTIENKNRQMQRQEQRRRSSVEIQKLVGQLKLTRKYEQSVIASTTMAHIDNIQKCLTFLQSDLNNNYLYILAEHDNNNGYIKSQIDDTDNNMVKQQIRAVHSLMHEIRNKISKNSNKTRKSPDTDGTNANEKISKRVRSQQILALQDQHLSRNITENRVKYINTNAIANKLISFKLASNAHLSNRESHPTYVINSPPKPEQISIPPSQNLHRYVNDRLRSTKTSNKKDISASIMNLSGIQQPLALQLKNKNENAVKECKQYQFELSLQNRYQKLFQIEPYPQKIASYLHISQFSTIQKNSKIVSNISNSIPAPTLSDDNIIQYQHVEQAHQGLCPPVCLLSNCVKDQEQELARELVSMRRTYRQSTTNLSKNMNKNAAVVQRQQNKQKGSKNRQKTMLSLTQSTGHKTTKRSATQPIQLDQTTNQNIGSYLKSYSAAKRINKNCQSTINNTSINLKPKKPADGQKIAKNNQSITNIIKLNQVNNTNFSKNKPKENKVMFQNPNSKNNSLSKYQRLLKSKQANAQSQCREQKQEKWQQRSKDRSKQNIRRQELQKYHYVVNFDKNREGSKSSFNTNIHTIYRKKC